ncbi:MAG: ComF family protein [Firmicutes bacterium]|nr:ComF family protein [Bacillota bacterium]
MKTSKIITETLRRVIYPPRCLFCGSLLDYRTEIPLCENCRPERYLPQGPRCSICSRPVGHAGDRCPGCRNHQSRIRGRGTFVYDGAVLESVHAVKDNGMKDYAKGYAELMVRYDERIWCEWGQFFLVPVPVHPRRLLERGYNQAEVLARELGERLDVPVWTGLQREEATRALRGQGAKSRRESLARAFRVDGSVPRPAGKAVIVDDIYTSGATVESCAKAIQDVYPEQEVCFWTFSIRT